MPLTVLVLIGAVGGGLVLQRAFPAQPRTAGQPGSPAVQQSPSDIAEISFTPDAQAHPDSARIHWTLQLHFNAINMRQYETWKNTVVEERQQQLPEDEWQKAYASTRDAAIKVHRIEPGPDDSLRLLLSFVSIQNPADAPAGLHSPCVRWRAVYPLVLDRGAFRVDTTPPGGAIAEPC